MRTIIIGLVLLALVSAGGVAFLAKRLTQYQASAKTADVKPEESDSVRFVLVADKDMPAGTQVSSKHLRWQAWPRDGIQSTFVVARKKDAVREKEFTGTVIRRGVTAGTPLTKSMIFKRENAGFLAGALQPGMRAITIGVTPASGGAGFILPGDHVDVILTHDVRRDLPKNKGTVVIAKTILRNTAETILRNVRVLAIDQKFKDFKKEATLGKTVTLEVTPKQAETLIVAKIMGRISLTLRSLAQDASLDTARSFTTDLEVSPTLMAALGASVLAVKAEARAKQLTTASRAAARAAKKTEAQAKAVSSAAKLSQTLAPGTRAVTVSVTAASGAAGFIQPGDRVDVILTHDIRKGGASGAKGGVAGNRVIRFTAETILRNIPVLAIDQKAGAVTEQANLAKTVTLQVSAREAETLAVAAMMGSISLSLRSPSSDVAQGENPAFTSDVQISPTLKFALGQLAETAAEAARAAKTTKPAGAMRQPVVAKVKVYKGGEVTTIQVGGP